MRTIQFKTLLYPELLASWFGFLLFALGGRKAPVFCKTSISKIYNESIKLILV